MTSKKTGLQTHEEGQTSSEHLLGDFKALVADAQALIEATSDHEHGPIAAIRSKALETLESAKETLCDIEGGLTDKAKVLAEGADEFVHRKPWESVGIAVGLGLVVGLLISRR